MFRQIKTLISSRRHFDIPDKQTEIVSCGKYEARLEDYLQGAEDPELDGHLTQCVNCSTALENARLGRELLYEAWEPTVESEISAGYPSEQMTHSGRPSPSNGFAAGVMARIREENVRGESRAAFWNPLEFLASRVSLTAAALLFAMSIYMVGVGHFRAPSSPAPAQSELKAADFPQPPGEPDNNEDVLQSLVERDSAN